VSTKLFPVINLLVSIKNEDYSLCASASSAHMCRIWNLLSVRIWIAVGNGLCQVFADIPAVQT